MCPTPSTWTVWLHWWCRSPPPFHTFYSHALVSVGMRCYSPYNILQLHTIGTTTNHLKPSGNDTTLEPPGTYTTLGFSWMCPTPIIPETYGCTGVQVPPPSYILFPCSGLCGRALPFSILVDTIGTTWNHVELLGFSWMCPTPSTWNVWLHWCAGPPPFHTFFSHALGCVGVDLPYPQNLCVTIFTHSPYYWKLLEPPGTCTTLGFSWICPTPSTYALSFSLLLETIGATWNLYNPRILLDLPYPQYLCVTIFPTTGNYWNHLELIRP